MSGDTEATQAQDLVRYVLDQARRCVQSPRGLFRHAWMAPMPHSGELRRAFDGFQAGDYSAGLFHHDASEASIELLQHPDLREAAAGSLLCLLDAQLPSGFVPRSLLADKIRDPEPSRPVLAQYALRAAHAMGAEWAVQHRVYERVVGFVRYVEREYCGLHGLFLTHSSLASGFDNDVLTAGLPDRSVEGPETNASMVLEYRALDDLERLLGRPDGGWSERAGRLRDRIEQLMWVDDPQGGFYTALRWQFGATPLDEERVAVRQWDGTLRPLESWLSLFPLYAGIPAADRAGELVRRLLNTDGYWGPTGVRTVPRWSPFFHQGARVLHFDFKKGMRGPVSNWCGPVWVLSNYYVAEGLAAAGRAVEARELALRTARLLWRGLARQARLCECYDDEGTGLWPGSGTFISWNVLVVSLLRRHAPDLLGAGHPGR